MRLIDYLRKCSKLIVAVPVIIMVMPGECLLSTGITSSLYSTSTDDTSASAGKPSMCQVLRYCLIMVYVFGCSEYKQVFRKGLNFNISSAF